jgi:hypothetical protein
MDVRTRFGQPAEMVTASSAGLDVDELGPAPSVLAAEANRTGGPRLAAVALGQ